MDAKMTATHCLGYDLLQVMHHQEDLQCQMSDAEVLTTVLTAIVYFWGNVASTWAMLQQYGYRSHICRQSISSLRDRRSMQRG